MFNSPTAADPGLKQAGATEPPTFDDAFFETLLSLFAWRRDVRRFRADPVPPSLVRELMAMADRAPSVGLSQPWRFVLVSDHGRRAAVRGNFEASNADALAAQPDHRAAGYARLKLAGLDQAPCQFAVFCEPEPEQGGGLGRMTMPQTPIYSTVMAVHTLWLAARAKGLGLGWISILDPAAVAKILETPPTWIFIGYFCLGRPESESLQPELEAAGWEQRRKDGPVILER